MSLVNIECKAKTNNLVQLEKKLQTLNPIFIGTDNQTDTYFNITEGRLKLRAGNIENALIWYKRADFASAKQSDIILYNHKPDAALANILTQIHGIKVVVQKKRNIYFIENVKFHFDEVNNLGTFIEIEAIDKDGTIGVEKLTAQCQYYAAFFGIAASDYVDVSYSDMLLAKTGRP